MEIETFYLFTDEIEAFEGDRKDFVAVSNSTLMVIEVYIQKLCESFRSKQRIIQELNDTIIHEIIHLFNREATEKETQKATKELLTWREPLIQLHL